MKWQKKALSVSLAAAILSLSLFGTISFTQAEGQETTLTLEDPGTPEPGMDAEAGADWMADNLMKEATVTVSGNPNLTADQNAQHKGNMFSSEASSEWSVGESGMSDPSVPMVTAEFEEPQTVKQIVLANCNNPTRFISKAKVTLTDVNNDTYVLNVDDIDKGGVPKGYTLSQAVNNVVKVEIVATEQGQQANGELSNGWSYVGVLDKRYPCTGNKVYNAINFYTGVGVYDDTDGLEGVYVPASAATGNCYLLSGTSDYTGRRPRLVAGEYKVTLYAKLYADSAVENGEQVILKLKYDNATVDFTRADFTETDQYVKIEKTMTLDGTKNADLMLEYQSGSGAVKIDKILIGFADAQTPDPVQPVPPEVDPDELKTELPGVTGDEYDPDPDKTWLTANLLPSADSNQLVNAYNENAENLFDGNEATSWTSDTGKAVITADFSQLSEKPTIKKIILVAPYTRDGCITKAKITITTADGTEKFYNARGLLGGGQANEITFETALENVTKVTIESLDDDLSGPGWAEVALLDKRYAHERSYFVEYMAASNGKESGTVDPPTSATEANYPDGDWPRGVRSSNTGTGYMVWTPQFVVPAGDYKVAIYAKIYAEDVLEKTDNLFNLEAFGRGYNYFKGTDFSQANAYEILTGEFSFTSTYSDRLSIWNYNAGMFKVYKVVVYTENMADSLTEPPVYTPPEPDPIPEGIEDPESPEAGYDPQDDRDWVEANLLNTENATVTVSAQDGSKGYLYDGNEANEWQAIDQPSAKVTITFKNPVQDVKRLILVSRYNNESYISKAKITITNNTGEKWEYEEQRLRAFGAATEVTLKEAAHNVVEVTIESTEIKGENPGWAELAVLEARYDYERHYVRTIQAVDFSREEGRGASDGTGVICLPTQPRGHILMDGTTVTFPATKFRTVLYVKALDEQTLSIGNVLELKIPNSGGWRQVQGTALDKDGEYTAFVFDHEFQAPSYETMQIFYWAESKASVKVQKVVIMDENSPIPEADPEVEEVVPELPADTQAVDSYVYTLSPENNVIRNDNAGNPTASFVGSSLNFSLQNHTEGGVENGKEMAYMTTGSKVMRFYLRIHDKTQQTAVKLTLLRYNHETDDTVAVITRNVSLDNFQRKLDQVKTFDVSFDAVEGYGYSFRIDWPATAGITVDRVEIVDSGAPVYTGEVKKEVEPTETDGVYTVEIIKDMIEDISSLDRLAIPAGNVCYELSNATLTRYLRHDNGTLFVTIAKATPEQQKLIDDRILFTQERNMAFLTKSYDAVYVKVEFRSAVGTTDIEPNPGNMLTINGEEAKAADPEVLSGFEYSLEHETLSPAEWYDVEAGSATFSAGGTNLYLLGEATEKYLSWKENEPPEAEITPPTDPTNPGSSTDPDDTKDPDASNPDGQDPDASDPDGIVDTGVDGRGVLLGTAAAAVSAGTLLVVKGRKKKNRHIA